MLHNQNIYDNNQNSQLQHVKIEINLQEVIYKIYAEKSKQRDKRDKQGALRLLKRCEKGISTFWQSQTRQPKIGFSLCG